jgi:hypothetical protein
LLLLTAPAARASGAASFGSGATLPAAGDFDARLVPWSTLRRLALEAGLQPVVDEPLGSDEWQALLAAIAAADGPVRDDAGERRALGALAGMSRPGPWLGGRVLLGYADRGALQTGEAGLAWGPGWNAAAEFGAQAARGRWWAALTARAQARPGWGAGPSPGPAQAAEALSWPGWDPATGPAQQRRAVLLGDGAELDLVRGMVGVGLGRWALGLGWDPRRSGPGLGGSLLLDRNGPPFAALTARRTAPLRWRGFMRPLGPEQLLLRVGLLGEQVINVDTESEGVRRDRPWFFQWLARWRVTDWCRLGCTQTALAVPRDGTLWPDVLQINLPLSGVTWSEQERGPLTDRLFATHLEFRWRRAPWPWLPSAAGRAWWEYAGTDFLPRGPGGLIPEISAPASVAGCELVGPRWDLAFEYAETLHPLVLWYSNGSFTSGYAHEGWLLGHELGGAGERLSALARVRPHGADGSWYAEIGGSRTTWGDEGHTPARANERAVSMALGALRDGIPGPWRARVDWHRTEVLDASGGAHRRWWSAAVERRF